MSPHWRGWLKPENRCLIPANSFAEYAPEPDPATKKKDVVWFDLNEDRPLFAFAGIWTGFKGERGTKSKPIPGPHRVYGLRRLLCDCRAGLKIYTKLILIGDGAASEHQRRSHRHSSHSDARGYLGEHPCFTRHRRYPPELGQHERK